MYEEGQLLIRNIDSLCVRIELWIDGDVCIGFGRAVAGEMLLAPVSVSGAVGVDAVLGGIALILSHLTIVISYNVCTAVYP